MSGRVGEGMCVMSDGARLRELFLTVTCPPYLLISTVFRCEGVS